MRPRFFSWEYFINVEKTKHIDRLSLGYSGETNWRWPDFSPSEFSCQHCGQIYEWPDFMDRLQKARSNVGRPFVILSGHRCSLHNARVGGAAMSQHLKLAADISIRGHNLRLLLEACQTAGFTGFGFYQNFLHIDMGRSREWWSGEKAKKLWQI